MTHSEELPLPLYNPSTSASLSLYKSAHATSIQNTSAYWSSLASSKLDWFAPFSSVLTGSFIDGSVSWFAGGKLNICHNAIDRYCSPPYNRGNETAIIWEGDEPSSVKRISYRELQLNICRIANGLKSIGVQKGDVVTLYMPMVPELAMTMLACARIGAVHSVIFAGFSADAIADRIQDAKSKWVVTAASGSRGGRNLPLKTICDVAVKKERCVGIVQKVLVFDGAGSNGNEWDQDESLHVRFTDLVSAQRPVCACEWMDAEDPLFILYTSGSTGRPKGLVHTTGGYALYAMHTTANSFGLSQQTGPSKEDDPHRDVYACVADAGWITGHTYIGELFLDCVVV
jgi:acetyl-CoA synthetase